MPKMLKNHLKGKIHLSDTLLSNTPILNFSFTVFPKTSKIQSIGFSKRSNPQKIKSAFETVLDKGFRQTQFSLRVQLNSK